MSTGTRSMGGQVFATGRRFPAMGAAGMAGAQGTVRPVSRVAVLLVSGAGVVLLWTLSYLLRQPAGGIMEDPAAYARHALEGMALALVWLGAILGGCGVVLTGVVTVRVRD